jgi:hypothetical protein
MLERLPGVEEPPYCLLMEEDGIRRLHERGDGGGGVGGSKTDMPAASCCGQAKVSVLLHCRLCQHHV